MKIEYYIETTLLKYLKTKNIDSIRVNNLIEEIGICKGTFYKYYQDKYQLMIRSFENFFYKDILNGVDNWESFTDNSLTAFRNSPAVILNAFVSQDINSLKSYHELLLKKFFVTNKSLENAEYYGYAAEVFARYVTDIIIDWLKGKCSETNEKLIERMKAVMPVTLYKTIYG